MSEVKLDDLFTRPDLPASPAGRSLVDGGDAAIPPPPPSPTAFRSSEWHRAMGASIAKQYALNEKMTGQEAKNADRVAEDFHAAAFEPDIELHETCTVPDRLDFARSLQENPDFRSMRETTALNAIASEEASIGFSGEYAKYHQQREDLRKKYEDKREDMRRRHVADREDAETAADEASALAEKEKFDVDLAGLKCSLHACKKVKADLKEMDMLAGAMGMGPGRPGGSIHGESFRKLLHMARNDEQLRKIIEDAGPLRLLAYSKQGNKPVSGPDELFGIEPAGRIRDLLPSELALLDVPELEMEFYRKLVEQQALCWKRRSYAKKNRGSLLMTCDTSGSMQGPKVASAKALCLAGAQMAHIQQRWCGLVDYSGDTGELLLTLQPGVPWPVEKMAEWCMNFFSCGSCLDVPLRELPGYWEQMGAPKGTTDVIMITDAIASVPSHVRESFLAWKKQTGARVIAIIIQSERAGDLEAVCDRIHYVRSINPSEPAIGEVLSL